MVTVEISPAGSASSKSEHTCILARTCSRARFQREQCRHSDRRTQCSLAAAGAEREQGQRDWKEVGRLSRPPLPHHSVPTFACI